MYSENLNEKRLEGENELYICELIRNDSIDDFILYASKNQFVTSFKIKKSVFESNSFLLDIEPTLIEYAAFFGPIQIFRYLRYNDVALSDVTLPPSINEIKKFAFYECFSLRQIQLPQPLAVLGDDVFNSCSKLSEIVIPSSVAQIEYDCSAKCSSLKI